MTTLSLGWRILRAEGVRSFGERALERWDEARERRSYRPLGSSRFSLDLLNLSPVPPSPRRGGVETQLAARRRAESRLRTIALLFPLDGRYRLEIDDRTEARARRYAADLGPAPKLTTYGFEVLEPRALGAAVEAARGLTGVRNVHVENPAGFDLGALGSLVATFDAAVLSVHDHSLFCPRSDLFSPPLNAFCSYSTDRVTCASCLRAPEGWQETRRVQSQQLLDQVASVIFPSPYLLAVHEELFAAIDTTRWHTIAPAAETLPAPLSSLEKQRIAYVGAARPAKGANLFADLVSHLSTRHHNLEFHAFGGGDRLLDHALERALLLCHEAAERGGCLTVPDVPDLVVKPINRGSALNLCHRRSPRSRPLCGRRPWA